MTSGKRIPHSPRTTIFILYFFSGASALVYQIVWARMLGLIIGTAVSAWAAVLAAYMGGMALGSAIGGRVADRVARPLAVLALCELGIGLYGIASPVVLHGMQQFGILLPAVPGLQFFIAMSTLIIPTMFMGATFPLVSRAAVVDKKAFGRDLGILYAVNTSGAILGALSAGFLLLPFPGMKAAITVAASLNIAVAASLFLLFRSRKNCGHSETPSPTDANLSSGKPVPRFLFPVVLAGSGFCAMAFEVLWSRALVFFLTSTTYSYTIMLSMVLAGIAAGGSVAARIATITKRPGFHIAMFQIGIAVFGIMSPLLLKHLDHIVHFNETAVTNVWWYWIGVRFAASFVLIFPPAFYMGATFPLAVGASTRSARTLGSSVGTLTALNTLGGIAGSLAAAFVLIPLAGIQRSMLLVAAINWVGGIAVVVLGAKASKKVFITVTTVPPVLLVVILMFSGMHPMVLYSRVVRNAGNEVALISYKEDPAASVAVLESPRDRKLNIDGFNAAGTYKYEYMHLLAHLPVLLSGSPDTTLVICLGSGTTAGITALYPQVRHVDCAEISKAVIASAEYFTNVNYHVTGNPKVNLLFADGRNHLLRSSRQYDVITLEPMLPYLASATNLYSADFYELCRSRLSGHGVMAQWAPMHVLSKREYRMLIATFASVFPHTSLWVLGSEGILIGTMEPLRIDPDALRKRMSPSAPMADLKTISLTSPERLLSCFLMDGKQINIYTGDVPVITDDRYGLEFSAPHTRILPIWKMWQENMNELLRNRVPVQPFITHMNDSTRAILDRYRNASTLILRAQMFNAQDRSFEALSAADSALQLMPGDVIAATTRREAADRVVTSYLRQARSARQKGDPRTAEFAYLSVIAADSTNTDLLFEIADFYLQLGRDRKVIEFGKRAIAAAPNDPAVRTNFAILYLNLNNHMEGEKELLHAIRLNRNFGRAYYFLAQLYQMSGRSAEAREAFRHVQELGYRE